MMLQVEHGQLGDDRPHFTITRFSCVEPVAEGLDESLFEQVFLLSR